MDAEKIEAAAECVKRFRTCKMELRKAAKRSYDEACRRNPDQYKCSTDSELIDRYLSTGTRESGALRRASMDLTRALAELRK